MALESSCITTFPKDMPVLTPNLFLIGQMGGEVAPESVNYTLFNPRKRLRHVQELIRQTWRRWMHEYLTSLGSRSKCFDKRDNVKKGEWYWLLILEHPDENGN